MRTLLPAALAAALLACGAGTSDLEERIPVQPGGLLEVDLYMGEGLRPDKGSLEVTSHDANEVRIAADVSGWGASGVNFRVEHDSSTVRLYGRVTGALSWLFGGPQLAVRIWVPREFSLDLRTSAGPVRIDDVSGSGGGRNVAGIADNSNLVQDGGNIGPWNVRFLTACRRLCRGYRAAAPGRHTSSR